MDFIVDAKTSIEQSPPRILVVDDDPLNQRMMQVLLKREGCEVDLASNGSEALEAVKHQKYAMIFMDLQMPIMDGMEASQRIREWENGNGHTFVVALTASYLPENGQKLFEAGIDNYIAKPFELEHIQRLLKYSLGPQTGDSIEPLPDHDRTTADVLDIQRGVEQVGGDLETYRELLTDFVEELPERLRAIQHSLNRVDMDGLSRAAHNLQGVAANLGALQLSEYARRLDKASLGGYTDSVRRLAEELQVIGGTLLRASNDFLAAKKANA